MTVRFCPEVPLKNKYMKKVAECLPVPNTRELIKAINNMGIRQEDIVTVLNIKEQLFLIYYKGVEA